MTGKKKTLAEKLADEARQQYEESKKKADLKAKTEALMADVEAKLKANQPKSAHVSEAAAKAKSNAESLMDNLAAKLKSQQPKATPKPAPEIYEVQPGDSLSKIAKEKLGDINRWQEIFEANKDQIKDPNLIQVGQKLVIPR